MGANMRAQNMSVSHNATPTAKSAMLKITELVGKGSLAEWLKNAAPVVSLDLETTDLGKGSKILSGAVTGKDENEVAFFGPELLDELLSLPSGHHLVFHNASFDLKHLAWSGVRLLDSHSYTDTLILAHLLDENGEHGLGPLVLKYYGDNYKEEFWKAYPKAELAPKWALAQYNAKDVHYTLRLHNKLRDLLHSDGVPVGLLTHVHALQRSLLATEIDGLRVDTDYLMQKGVELKTRIEQIIPQMRETVSQHIEVIECNEWVKEIEKRKTDAGRQRVKRPEFTFDSAKQLMALLYEQLGLEKQYNEKTKNLTCDWDALEKLKEKHPIIPMIQEYREKQKIYGTYIEGTLERMVEGRIYPSVNVAGTATGRISHSNPNMGNMPRDGGIRGMFIPDRGYVFISADFSQLEVCLSAHFTRDENLLRIVNEGASQHDITSASLGIPRALAKTVNFGMQYGCSHYKVAKVLGVSPEKGKEAYEKYWKTYSGQKRVMDECAAKVDQGVPIVSPFGRRRRFEVRKRQAWDSAYRQAWNALVQGTGSDCTSRAFYLADAQLRAAEIGKALFTVHDEIVITAKEEHAAEAEQVLLEAMSTVGQEIGLTVSLKAQGSGPMNRWED
jgi:DNA polymerase-1